MHRGFLSPCRPLPGQPGPWSNRFCRACVVGLEEPPSHLLLSAEKPIHVDLEAWQEWHGVRACWDPTDSSVEACEGPRFDVEGGSCQHCTTSSPQHIG